MNSSMAGMSRTSQHAATRTTFAGDVDGEDNEAISTDAERSVGRLVSSVQDGRTEDYSEGGVLCRRSLGRVARDRTASGASTQARQDEG